MKVAFESRMVTAAFGLLAALSPRFGRWLLPWLARPSSLLCGLGSSGGVVMAELFFSDGSSHRTAIVARQDGQRLALPAVYVGKRLCRGAACPRGAVTACEVLGAGQLVDLLAGDGYEVAIPPAVEADTNPKRKRGR